MGQIVHSLRTDSRPLYIQMVDALYELLEHSIYEAGQPLPAEAELAARLGVSRSTIREALSHLEKDGLIIRKQGVGTFVRPRSAQITGGLERLVSFRSVAELAGETVQVVARTVRLVNTDAAIVATLQLPPESPVVQVCAIEAVNGRRLAYLEGFIAPELVSLEQLAANDGSLLEHLAQQAHLPLAYSRTTICAIAAEADLADRLNIAAGREVLRLNEIVYTDTDAPIALFRNYFITDRYHYTVVRRIVRPMGQIRRMAD